MKIKVGQVCTHCHEGILHLVPEVTEGFPSPEHLICPKCDSTYTNTQKKPKTEYLYKEFPWEKIGSWKRTDPYTMMFVYPMNSKPFILKGSLIKIVEYMSGYREPAMTFRALFCRGRAREIEGFVNLPNNMKAYWTKFDFDSKGKGIFRRSNKVNTKFTLMAFNGKGTKINLTTAKRVPRCFPKQLKDLIEVINTIGEFK